MKKRVILLFISVILINLICAESDDYFSLNWKFSADGGVVFVDTKDLENDGNREIIIGSREFMLSGGAGWINILEKDGNCRSQYPLPGPLTAMVVADLENDGEREIMASVFSRIHVLDKDGKKKWDMSPRYGYNIREIYVDDLDGDGTREILVGAGPKTSRVRDELFVISSTGKILWSVYVRGEIHSIASGDLDGDGSKEILIGCYGRGGTYNSQAVMYVFNSTGEERFKYTTERGVASILVDDINSDGVKEILVGTYRDLYVLDNEGNDLWQYSTNGLIRKIISDDIDNDTEKEIILASNDVYAVTSDGDLDWKNAVGPEVYDLRVMDLNKDGLKEIIVGSDSAYILDSDGETLWEYTTGGVVNAVSVGDLENDGYFELALGSADKTLYLFQSETYAKEEEASKNYRIAERYYNKKDFDEAMRYALKAKELYSEVENEKGLRDTETLISKIESDSKRLNQEESQADIYYNKSVNSYLAGDYINASKYAQKAKYKYSYLKNYEAVEKCNELINNSNRFLEIESQGYLQNSSDSYGKGDYEPALIYAERARDGYEWLRDEEDILRVDELLAKIYYKLAETHCRIKDFKNASIFIQKSLYIYLCLENKSSSTGIGCDPDNAEIRDVKVLAENISGEKYEDSRYREELLKINSLIDRISKEDTGNPIDRISDAIGSNLLYILIVILILIVLALLVASLYLMARQQKSRKSRGLMGLRKGEKRKSGKKRITKRSIDKVRRDRLRGEGLPIKKTMYNDPLEEL